MGSHLTQAQSASLVEIAQRADARLLILFGSVARGDEHVHSDLDLAFDLGKPADLDIHLQLIQEVEGVVRGVRADLVFLSVTTPPLLRYQIFSEGRSLCEDTPGRFDQEYLRAWRLYLDTRRLREYERDYLSIRAREASDVR